DCRGTADQKLLGFVARESRVPCAGCLDGPYHAESILLQRCLPLPGLLSRSAESDEERSWRQRCCLCEHAAAWGRDREAFIHDRRLYSCSISTLATLLARHSDS